MNKSNSAKKISLKKSGRKDYVNHYEPLFVIASPPKEKRSSSITPERKTRHSVSGEIPNILKRNIAALSESSESIKLTEFGKSFVEDKSPPKKKPKTLFEKLLCDDSKNIEIVQTNFENKRLKNLKSDARQPVTTLLSSPSIMDTKSNSPTTILKFPIDSEAKEVESTVVDAFDKLKHLEIQPNDSKHNDKEEVVVIKDNSNSDEKASKENKEKKHLDEKKSVNDSSSSSSHSAIINKSTEIDGKIIKNYRDSLNRFRQMLNGIKSINAKILAFRQELSEGLMCEIPSTQQTYP